MNTTHQDNTLKIDKKDKKSLPHSAYDKESGIKGIINQRLGIQSNLRKILRIYQQSTSFTRIKQEN